MAKFQKPEGVYWVSKAPNMDIKEDWQIKLGIIANTNRSDFADDKTYNEYIETHTRYAIEEQAAKLKNAWKELDRQKTPAN